LHETFRALKDLLNYIALIKSKRFSIIQTNTSIGSLGILRDGLFILVARYFNLNIVVFFHGLHENTQKKIEKNFLFFFKWLFFRADCMIVLSSQFKQKLRLWGYKKEIFVETTVVDSDLIKDIDEKYIQKKFGRIGSDINLLFFARVERSKGIYEAINAYKILKKKYPKLTFTVAGDGFELDKVKSYVRINKISGVTFLGFITGHKKIEAYKSAHIYIFPSYSEGMPTSVLEAMASGLPVVTRSVGGIVDFFQMGINGFMTDTKDPIVFAEFIERLLNDKSLAQQIALNNFSYAKENFMDLKVVARLENIYNQVLKER